MKNNYKTLRAIYIRMCQACRYYVLNCMNPYLSNFLAIPRVPILKTALERGKQALRLIMLVKLQSFVVFSSKIRILYESLIIEFASNKIQIYRSETTSPFSIKKEGN